MNRYFLIAILSGMLSSFSQILLKKSALKQYDTFLKQYLNPLVIGGYGITALCMVLTILAYRGMPYKYGRRKTAGMFVIVAGVIVFSLGG